MRASFVLFPTCCCNLRTECLCEYIFYPRMIERLPDLVEKVFKDLVVKDTKFRVVGRCLSKSNCKCSLRTSKGRRTLFLENFVRQNLQTYQTTFGSIAISRVFIFQTTMATTTVIKKLKGLMVLTFQCASCPAECECDFEADSERVLEAVADQADDFLDAVLEDFATNMKVLKQTVSRAKGSVTVVFECNPRPPQKDTQAWIDDVRNEFFGKRSFMQTNFSHVCDFKYVIVIRRLCFVGFPDENHWLACYNGSR